MLFRFVSNPPQFRRPLLPYKTFTHSREHPWNRAAYKLHRLKIHQFTTLKPPVKSRANAKEDRVKFIKLDSKPANIHRTHSQQSLSRNEDLLDAQQFNSIESMSYESHIPKIKTQQMQALIDPLEAVLFAENS